MENGERNKFLMAFIHVIIIYAIKTHRFTIYLHSANTAQQTRLTAHAIQKLLSPGFTGGPQVVGIVAW